MNLHPPFVVTQEQIDDAYFRGDKEEYHYNLALLKVRIPMLSGILQIGKHVLSISYIQTLQKSPFIEMKVSYDKPNTYFCIRHMFYAYLNIKNKFEPYKYQVDTLTLTCHLHLTKRYTSYLFDIILYQTGLKHLRFYHMTMSDFMSLMDQKKTDTTHSGKETSPRSIAQQSLEEDSLEIDFLNTVIQYFEKIPRSEGEETIYPHVQEIILRTIEPKYIKVIRRRFPNLKRLGIYQSMTSCVHLRKIDMIRKWVPFTIDVNLCSSNSPYSQTPMVEHPSFHVYREDVPEEILETLIPVSQEIPPTVAKYSSLSGIEGTQHMSLEDIFSS
jgi:hypothetical protein